MSHVPVWSHTTSKFLIRSYGMLVDPYDENQTKDSLTLLGSIAHEAGAEQVLWPRFANNRFPEGRAKVSVFEKETKEFFVTKSTEACDGILITKPGDAVVCTTKDCPVLILAHKREQGVLVLHCGRDALHGIDRGRACLSVIFEGFKEWMPKNPKEIFGALTLGIHHSNFPNRHIPGIVAELKDLWGKEVVPDPDNYSLDLTELILRQLETLQIPRDAVVHDGLDTFSDTRLGSVRGARGNAHNAVFVVTR